MKTWVRILFTAGTLVWSNFALGGEIHAAAARGDVEKTKALLAANPDLVSSTDEHGWTPLYWAAAFTKRLIAIATTPRINAQNAAIEALAFNRTDEGVITLNTLLDDPDAKISKMTEDAIRNAYTSRGNARGVPLRPEDFDAKLRAPK
jgi:ankyrin repeat protein